MKAARWQESANAAIAALAVLIGVAAGCGDDMTATSRAAASPTTTADLPGPTSSVTSTSVVPALEAVDLDDGRVLLHVPDGLTLIDSRTKTGVFGETIRLWRYRGSTPVVVVTIAILRGPMVVDRLLSETNNPSDVTPFEDREYFEDGNELAPLINSKSLGWQIGPDAVIWLSATDLSIDEVADIASHVDVV